MGEWRGPRAACHPYGFAPGSGGLHLSINAGGAPATSGSICPTRSIHPDDVGNRALRYWRGPTWPDRWMAKQQPAKLGPRARQAWPASQMSWLTRHEPRVLAGLASWQLAGLGDDGWTV